MTSHVHYTSVPHLVNPCFSLTDKIFLSIIQLQELYLVERKLGMTVNEEKIRLVSDQLDIQVKLQHMGDLVNQAAEDISVLDAIGAPIELMQTCLAAMVTYADVLAILCQICLTEEEISEINQMFEDARAEQEK